MRKTIRSELTIKRLHNHAVAQQLRGFIYESKKSCCQTTSHVPLKGKT
ncbi:hypothetical protein XBFM1_1400001 [Xenorhabdus bovienii str. feltiae Moldova]|uniref:Uncharacterized protein n=2 Tax=Xenorhabdus bovienii TaxID=40576 RepID=A0A0B6XA83_XENBV|nr:hypothetical protein XBFM1_1400001 [Xenorhabdus bovienii str. feltiae Moldova]CDM89204.1 hypothetical protein XBW1_1847 [Xenorhabdus bovienii]